MYFEPTADTSLASVYQDFEPPKACLFHKSVLCMPLCNVHVAVLAQTLNS